MRHQLRDLGLATGDLVMVHASLRAVGATGEAVVAALRDVLGPGGTLMCMPSWDASPYEETLNGAAMSAEARDAWPAFDPATAKAYPGWDRLNTVILREPGVERSGNPDSSMAAVGPLARELMHPHPIGSAYGPGSPLERFVAHGGKTLLLGAPLDAVTVLHYAEAVADIPGKRRITYEMPVLDANGEKAWVKGENWDSNGITDRFAAGPMDAVETIARAYVAEGRHREGLVGRGRSYLFDARDLVAYGVAWLEADARS